MSKQNADPPAVVTDLTSCYGFLAHLTGDVDKGWARENYLDITVLTLKGDNIRMPLPPADNEGPNYDLSPLRARFQFGDVPQEKRDEGLEHQSRWLRNASYAQELRKFLDGLLGQTFCDIWLSWHIEHEWVEHIFRCQGLVEKDYEDLVSILVPEQSAEDIKAINERALDDPKGFSEAATDTYRRLFTADVVRRGLYYRCVTERLTRQQLLHQTRRIPPPPGDSVRQRDLALGFEPFLMADIIRMHTAIADSDMMRVAQWVEAVGRAGPALRQQWKPPDPAGFERSQKALDSAAERVGQIARRLEFSTASRAVHRGARLLGTGIGGGIGAAAGLLLGSYLGDRCGTAGRMAIIAGGAGGAMLGHAIAERVEPVLMKRDSDPCVAARRLASAGPEHVRSSLTLYVPSEPPSSH